MPCAGRHARGWVRRADVMSSTAASHAAAAPLPAAAAPAPPAVAPLYAPAHSSCSSAPAASTSSLATPFHHFSSEAHVRQCAASRWLTGEEVLELLTYATSCYDIAVEKACADPPCTRPASGEGTGSLRS